LRGCWNKIKIDIKITLSAGRSFVENISAKLLEIF
jgi:hypothetical protein